MTEQVVQIVLVSGLTLFVVARLVGRARATDLVSRRTTCRELKRLRELVEVCAIAGADDAAPAVAAALTEVLHLRDCWYEPHPDGPPLPVLSVDGDIGVRVVHRARGGLLLPERIALPARGGGRFVLCGSPTIGTTPEERLIAAAMAAALGVAQTSQR